MLINDDLKEESGKICTGRGSGRKSKVRNPSWVDTSGVPSERIAVIGEVVGTTSRKHNESDKRKKEEFAPESETTAHVLGVLRDRGILLKSIELQNDDDDTIADVGSPNTHASYLMRAHLDVLPPTGLAAVAVDT